MKKVISISAITMDGSTQMRARMDDEFIDELAEMYKGEAELPPPVVFWDKETYWLADGHHRVHAALKAECKGIQVEIREGGKSDAVLFACSANDDHGLRRTTADKRKAVRTLLEDKLWKTRSDRWIAQTCRVGPHLVANMRADLSIVRAHDAPPKTRKTSDGREYTVPDSDAKPTKIKPGQELFDFSAYFTHLNAMRRAPDHMYRGHGRVRSDGAINRDAEYEGLSRSLEAFHTSFEQRWFELSKQKFPKQ